MQTTGAENCFLFCRVQLVFLSACSVPEYHCAWALSTYKSLVQRYEL